MTAPRLAKSLVALRAECNAVAPNRKKTSDGWIGDAAHAARASAHNPNAEGVVCALDITHDPAGGMDGGALFEHCRTHPHPNLRYLIHNRKRAGRPDWTVKPYTGSNPHSGHVHFTVGTGSDSRTLPPYDDTTPWGIAQGQEDDMTPDEVRAIVRDEIDIIYSSDVAAAQKHLLSLRLLSAARDTDRAASVGFVLLMASRILKLLGK